jgi:hypothetical protein
MEFLIYTIIYLVCLIIFLIFIFIGKESLFTYFVIISSMLGIMWSISEIILLVGKGLTP